MSAKMVTCMKVYPTKLINGVFVQDVASDCLSLKIIVLAIIFDMIKKCERKLNESRII